MKKSKNLNLDKKHFLTVSEQINLLKTRGLKIGKEKSLEWYLTKYNYQSFINGYNDFFLVHWARNLNMYKHEANSDDLIRLFNFDRYISRFILGDIQNIERFLQNAIVQTFFKTYEKWKAWRSNKDEDMQFLYQGQILKLSDTSWKIIFSNDFEEEKSIKEEIIEKISREKNSKLLKKYEKVGILEMPIWSFILFLDFGTLIRIMRCFNDLSFETAIGFFQEKLNYKFEMNRDEFNSIFYLLKEVRNKICHSNVLYNYDNKSDQVMSINSFLKRNKYITKGINRIRFYDLIELISKISKNYESVNNSLKIITDKIIKTKQEFHYADIFDEILEYMHFKKNLN